MHKLFVCQTCKRDEPLDPGALSRGARLADALGDALQDDFRGGRREGVSLVRVAADRSAEGRLYRS